MSYQAWIVTVEEIEDRARERGESVLSVIKYLAETYTDKPLLLEHDGRLTSLVDDKKVIYP